MPPPRQRSDRPQTNQHHRRGGRFRSARPIRKVADYRAGSADPRHRPVAASGVVVRPGDARGFAELPIFQISNEFGGHPYVASEIGGNTSAKGDVRRPKQ
jgi:hypothetical protein